MRRLPEIGAAHELIDGLLENQRNDANLRGDRTAVGKVEDRKKINDQAYFVLCWGQIEAELNAACLKAIQKWGADSDRRKRRAWDIIEINKDRIRLSFEQRAELVLDKNDPAQNHRRLMRHYELRNRIAHGGIVADSIDLPSVIADFYRIYGAFEP